MLAPVSSSSICTRCRQYIRHSEIWCHEG